SGRLIVTDVRWGETELVEAIEADVILNGREARLRNLNGSFARGALNGQWIYQFAPAPGGRFHIQLEGADAHALAATWPEWATRIQGTVDLNLRGHGIRDWQGNGALTIARGVLGGAEVVDWQMPLEFSTAPADGRLQVDIRDFQATVGNGHASGQLSFGWGEGSRTGGAIRFLGVDL